MAHPRRFRPVVLSFASVATALGLWAWPSPADAQDPARRRLRLGYNQAWLEGAYGRDLDGALDEDGWRRVLRRAREGGASSVRVWLFEGKPYEGITWAGHRPTGVTPRFLANVRRLIDLAVEERVSLYWTALSANWPDHWPRDSIDYARRYNIYADKYGHGTTWREVALGPVLDVIAERPRAAFALDLMNEPQGAVRPWMWSDGWRGARRFLAETAAFVKRRCPGLRVTASSGHHTAVQDVLDGRFDGIGLDFLDVHVYADDGRVPRGDALARHARARGLPLVLGEFGQEAQRDDPALQARVTERFLTDAERLGFHAAFAWRLEDQQAHDRRFSFFDGDRPRPAYDVMRRWAGLPPCPPTTRGITGALGGP